MFYCLVMLITLLQFKEGAIGHRDLILQLLQCVQASAVSLIDASSWVPHHYPSRASD